MEEDALNPVDIAIYLGLYYETNQLGQKGLTTALMHRELELFVKDNKQTLSIQSACLSLKLVLKLMMRRIIKHLGTFVMKPKNL